MRFLLFILSVFLALPLHAAVTDQREMAQTCLMDKTEAGGKEYRSCEVDPRENALLEHGFMSARIDRMTQKSKQAIWVHGVCRYIDNRSATADYFVPFATAEEWQSFLKNMPKNMRTAKCCEPRALEITDIITPAQPCAGGWLLQSVVSVADYSTPLMNVSGGGFVGMDGKEIELPLLRDDENAVFEYQGQKQFAARFACSGGEPPATGTPVPDRVEDGITVIGTPPTAKPGEVGHTSFMAKCNKQTWRVISVRPCTPSEHFITASCEDYDFPKGTPGEVQIKISFTCPGEERVEEVVGNNCGAALKERD